MTNSMNIQQESVFMTPQEFVMRMLRELWADHAGVSAMQFALGSALIAVATSTAVTKASSALSATFSAVAADVSNSGEGSIASPSPSPHDD